MKFLLFGLKLTEVRKFPKKYLLGFSHVPHYTIYRSVYRLKYVS